MEKTAIFEKLVENAPLAVLLLGAAAFVLGATGGIYTVPFQLPVSDPLGRGALMMFGAVVVIVGGLLLWNDRRQKPVAELPKQDFNLQIISPLSQSRVSLNLHVRGTFEVEPPDGMARILELVPNTNTYHAKARITIDKKSKTWFADIKIGGKSGERRVLILVLAGKSADLLFEYYRVVGRETGRWIGIPGLPPDIVKCNQVEIEVE